MRSALLRHVLLAFVLLLGGVPAVAHAHSGHRHADESRTASVAGDQPQTSMARAGIALLAPSCPGSGDGGAGACCCSQDGIAGEPDIRPRLAPAGWVRPQPAARALRAHRLTAQAPPLSPYPRSRQSPRAPPVLP